MIGRWLEERKTRKARAEFQKGVDNQMWLLLALMPEPWFAGLHTAYPRLSEAAGTAFDTGETSSVCAISSAATVVSDQLEKLDAEKRSAISNGVMFWTQEAPSEPTGDAEIDGWVKTICGVLTQMSLSFPVDKDGVTQFHHDYMVDEMFGALRGESSQERVNERLLSSLRKSLGIK